MLGSVRNTIVNFIWELHMRTCNKADRPTDRQTYIQLIFTFVCSKIINMNASMYKNMYLFNAHTYTHTYIHPSIHTHELILKIFAVKKNHKHSKCIFRNAVILSLMPHYRKWYIHAHSHMWHTSIHTSIQIGIHVHRKYVRYKRNVPLKESNEVICPRFEMRKTDGGFKNIFRKVFLPRIYSDSEYRIG